MTLADQLREEGQEKGLEKGLKKGFQESILEALEIRFGQIPDGLGEIVVGIHDPSRLRSLHKAAIKAATLEAFTAAL